MSNEQLLTIIVSLDCETSTIAWISRLLISGNK